MEAAELGEGTDQRLLQQHEAGTGDVTEIGGMLEIVVDGHRWSDEVDRWLVQAPETGAESGANSKRQSPNAKESRAENPGGKTGQTVWFFISDSCLVPLVWRLATGVWRFASSEAEAEDREGGEGRGPEEHDDQRRGGDRQAGVDLAGQSFDHGGHGRGELEG